MIKTISRRLSLKFLALGSLFGFATRRSSHAQEPEPASLKHRYELAHQKGSGFGLVTIDTKAKTYHIESFRFLIDATDGKKSNQFPGWPVTIHQAENRGENKLR